MGYSDQTCVLSDLGIRSPCRVYGIYLNLVRDEWHPNSGLIPGLWDDRFLPDGPLRPERGTLSLMRADVVDYLAPLSEVTPERIAALREGVAEGKALLEEGLPPAVAASVATHSFGFGAYLDFDSRTRIWSDLFQAPEEEYPQWVRLSNLFVVVKHKLARGWCPKHVTIGVQDSLEVTPYKEEYHLFLAGLCTKKS